MGNAAEDILGTKTAEQVGEDWTPTNNPDFRDLLHHFVEIVSGEFAELSEKSAGLSEALYREVVSRGDNGSGDALPERTPPGKQEVRGDVQQLRAATVQVADKRKGGSDGKEA